MRGATYARRMTVADLPTPVRATRLAQGVIILCGVLFCASVIVNPLGAATLAGWTRIAILCAFAGVGVWLSAIDIAQHRLPNRILLPAIGVFALAITVFSLATADGAAALRALASGAVCFATFFVIALASPRAIGGGDVKLVALTAMMSAWIGFEALVLALVAAFVLAGIVAIAAVLFRRGSARRNMAFGPFLCLGAWIGIGTAFFIHAQNF